MKKGKMEQKERVQEVTERTVVEYFDRLDAMVSSGTVLYMKIWGVGA